MQFRTTGLLLLGAMALPASGAAQTTHAPSAITRTVIAATKLPTVTDVPLHFKAVSITLQPDERSSVSAANGIPGCPSGRLTSSNVATWVLSNQDSRVAPQTLRDA